MAVTRTTPWPGPGPAQTESRSGFGVHWMLTGLLLGAASWSVIGAVVSAAFSAWMLAGVLLLGAVALFGTLVMLAASSARIRRARAARAEAARPEPGQRGRVTALHRRGQVA